MFSPYDRLILGLEAYFHAPMRDAGSPNTTVDVHGEYRTNGTMMQGVIACQQLGHKGGTAFKYDGDEAYVNFGTEHKNHYQMRPEKHVEINVWFCKNRVEDEGTLVSWGTTAKQSERVLQLSTHKNKLSVVANGTSYSAQVNILPGVAYLATLQCMGNDCEIYCNNVLIGSFECEKLNDRPDTDFLIGARRHNSNTDTADHFKGFIGPVSVNYPLKDDERAKLLTASMLTQGTNTVADRYALSLGFDAYYPMSNDALDYTGNDNHGESYNGVVFKNGAAVTDGADDRIGIWRRKQGKGHWYYAIFEPRQDAKSSHAVISTEDVGYQSKTKGFTASMVAGSKMQLSVANGKTFTRQVIPDLKVEVGKKYLLECGYANGQAVLAINGKSISFAADEQLFYDGGYLYFGSAGGSGQYFKMALHAAGWIDRRLTPEEIKKWWRLSLVQSHASPLGTGDGLGLG